MRNNYSIFGASKGEFHHVFRRPHASLLILELIAAIYEGVDDHEDEINLFQIKTNALANSCGFSATHFVTSSGANHPPVSISSGCRTNGPSLSQR